jgi:hypothetical protein
MRREGRARRLIAATVPVVVTVVITVAMAGPGVLSTTPPATAAETDGPIAWIGANEGRILRNPIDEVLGGYVMVGGPLPGLGGSLSTYEHISTWLQRNAVARGRFAAVGFYTTNYYDPRAPIAPWFDDSGWAAGVDAIRQVAATADAAGVGALAFDTEPYAGEGGVKHDDQWSDIGPAAGEANTEDLHAQARIRGEQVGEAIAGAGITELLAYGAYFSQSYWGHVQRAVNAMTDEDFAHDLGIDFWAGVIATGIQQITFENAVFYKGNILPGYSWESAFADDRAQSEAYWQERFGADASKARWAPMLWIDDGSPDSQYESTIFSPAQEQHRFTAAMSIATGPVVMYGHRFAGGFDYSPYVPALRAARSG